MRIVQDHQDAVLGGPRPKHVQTLGEMQPKLGNTWEKSRSILYVDIYIYVDVYITRVHVCEANFLQKKFFCGNCLIALLLRLAAQQCTKPQTSTNGGHEWEEDVRCHGGAPESRNVWVCLLLRGTTLET